MSETAPGNGDPNELVDVLDATSGTISKIPARELAPGMVQAPDAVTGRVAWVDANAFKYGEYRHPPFPPEIREVLREIQTSIQKFYPLTLEAWEDGFRRDTHPDKEIAIWIYMARLYRKLTTERDLSIEQRQDYFRLLITCLNSPQEHILKVFSPEAISREEAHNVIDEYYNGS